MIRAAIPAVDSAGSAAAIRVAVARRAIGRDMERKLTELVDRLKKSHGERLISVVLYGSAAGDDYVVKFSDLNILCVLSEVTPRELGHSEAVFRWWHDQGNPSPL